MTSPENQTLNAVKRSCAAQFRETGLDTPDLDARLLLMAATGFSHIDVITRGTEPVEAGIIQTLAGLTERRLAGEPIDHILGYREFYGREFKISKDVLSPRPETEMLIDEALETLADKHNPRLLDLGTGSGAIAVTLLAEMPNLDAVAVDISDAALRIALKNAKAHGVESRLRLLCGNWFGPVDGKFDIILSNPPYITDDAMKGLAADVKGFDPDTALRGGTDGLTAYRHIIAHAKPFLTPNGALIFEIGYDQGTAVSKLLIAQGFDDVAVHTDLSNHERMVTASYKA